MSNSRRKPIRTVCPDCRTSKQQVRNGRNQSGTERIICKACGGIYTSRPKPIGYDRKTVRAVLSTYLDYRELSNHVDGPDGMYLAPERERVCRMVARKHGIHHQTVLNWIRNWPVGRSLNQYLRRFPVSRILDKK